jgi:hypothetical protein
MPEEVTNVSEIKTTSDGTVKISVEKYNDLLKAAAAKPPVVHTTVVRTPEMLAKEYRMYGGGLMGLGASMLIVGAGLYRKGGRI